MATRHKDPLQEPRHRGALQRFGFLLVPNFSLIALSSAVDPLRLANMASGRWHDPVPAHPPNAQESGCGAEILD